MSKPSISRKIEFSEKHWRMLWKSAKDVSMCYKFSIDLGELVNAAWIGFARYCRQDNLVYRYMRSYMHKYVQRHIYSKASRLILQPQDKFITEYDPILIDFIDFYRLLPERKRFILKKLLSGERQTDVGKMISLTGERVRQLKKECLADFKCSIGED